MSAVYQHRLSPTEYKERNDERSLAISRYYARLKAIDAGAKKYQLMHPQKDEIIGEFKV